MNFIRTNLITLADVKLKNIEKDCASNPIHQSRFEILEAALNNLFIQELKSKDSIFINIAPDVIKKIAMFLSGITTRAASVGVCGETASGKSTIVLDSIDTINNFAQEFLLKDVVTRVNTDDYYFDRSKEVEAAGSFAEFTKTYDLDIPGAFELSLMKEHIQKLIHGQNVLLPKYDMSGTAKRFDNHSLATPSPIVIAEGLFTLVDEIADVFDFKIYVDIKKRDPKEKILRTSATTRIGRFC
jgi:uridine kinase